MLIFCRAISASRAVEDEQDDPSVFTEWAACQKGSCPSQTYSENTVSEKAVVFIRVALTMSTFNEFF